MGKLVGVTMMVLAFWIGSEIFSHGVDGAFGGLFSSSPTEVEERVNRVQRIGGKAEHALKVGEERVNRLVPE